METEYFCDADYIDYYSADLNPWRLDWLCSLNGGPRPDWSAGFDYCELGCGTGLSLILNAAANPESRFVGVDINPDHIRKGNRIIQNGKLTNAVLLEENFTGLLDRDLPAFDFIALHGVYSWISPAMRAKVREFIDHRLKPGGILYLSYNTMPGWAQQIPIRDIMHAHVNGAQGPTMDKVAKGLSYLKMLKGSRVPFFASSPQARQLVDHLLEADPRYVAHEFFTGNCEPFHFRAVAEEMGALGLEYMGRAPFHLNDGHFCLPDDLGEFFQGLPDRLAFETHKDFILNIAFRRDVYRRGAAPETGGHRLEGMVLGSCKARREFEFQFRFTDAKTVTLDAPVFGALADLLACNRMEVDALLRHETLAGFSREELLDAMAALVVSGQAQPFPRRPLPARTGLSLLNRYLLDRNLAAGPVTLASEAVGTGITLAQEDALLVLAMAKAGPAGAPAWMKKWCEKHKLQIAAQATGPDLTRMLQARAAELPLAMLGLPDPT
jgi:SAM-dependent methyltransferase